MAGYDPGVDNLQALCSALEATNHVLEVATPDLDTTGNGLTQAEHDLREALASLKTETGDFEKEVEASDTEAAAAATELGAAAHQALETWMPAFDEKVGDVKDHSHQALTQRSATLQSEFDELQDRGFDPLETVLTQEQSEFEGWTNEAEKVLKPLVEELEAAGAETTGDIQQASADLAAAHQAAEDERSNLANTLRFQLDEFDKNQPEEVEKLCGDASVSVPQWIEDDWGNSIKTSATVAHKMLEGFGKEASDGMEEEARQATDAVELAATALADAENEFERAAADAESQQPEIENIAELRPQIETADGEVTEIRALMEAVSQ